MKDKTTEQKIKLVVNYYAKKSDRESLTAAINKLIKDEQKNLTK